MRVAIPNNDKENLIKDKTTSVPNYSLPHHTGLGRHCSYMCIIVQPRSLLKHLQNIHSNRNVLLGAILDGVE
jgi:hypothetical protein